MNKSLFVRIISGNEQQIYRDRPTDGSKYYEIEHEPDHKTETLRYDSEMDSVFIEKRTKTPEQIIAEQKAAEDAALFKPDTIRALQGKIAELEGRLIKVEEGKI